jgi:hypothetical protein
VPIRAEGGAAVSGARPSRDRKRRHATMLCGSLLVLAVIGLAIAACTSPEVWLLGSYAFVGPRAGFSGEERPGKYVRIWRQGTFELFHWQADSGPGGSVVIYTEKAMTGISKGAGSRVRPK